MTISKRLPVTAAAAVIVILAGLLTVRVIGLSDAEAEPIAAAHATVPEAALADVAELTIPAWHKPGNRDWTVDFKTDLDLLAPLGNGAANAGAWFALFEKQRGPRAAEARALMARRVEHEILGKVYPYDDPVLKEAEAWCDQATMRFYPEIFPIEGWATRIPNLLVPLNFARTWVARGLAADDDRAAREDFRRAIRLGRLLRQEDAVLITDLVGLECIRLGAWGIFTRNRTGDPELAMIAAVVVGETAPQRLLTSERVTKVSVTPYARRLEDGSIAFEIPDSHLDAVDQLIASDGDRRFKGEAIITAQVIATHGTDSQRERMGGLLDDLASSTDPVVSALAAWVRDNELTEEELAEVLPK